MDVGRIEARAYSKRSWLNGFSTDFQPWMEGLRGRFLQKRDTALLYARSPFAIPRAQEIAILSQISTSASLVEIRETWTRKAYGSSDYYFQVDTIGYQSIGSISFYFDPQKLCDPLFRES